ncbi:MAG: DNA polymerase III subunit [Chloroflexota bacterium]
MRTRGQPVAVAAIRAMLGSGIPHAVLLTGPSGVGKTTLAGDIAAALLCTAPEVGSRPCRECRGCRMVEHGNHPDLHRLAPTGAGSVIPIGGRDVRGVRDLVANLAYLPIEGGQRVAIVEAAHRMTEDAQSAFLKTLEEPPAFTTIVLCADEEEQLLPTIRSRCVRVRLGPIGVRDLELVLAEQGVADPPTSARLARLAEGRPGLAISYARAPGAVLLRGEIARTLLDLLGAGLTARLVGVRELAARAAELNRALDAGAAEASATKPVRAGPKGRSQTSAPGSAAGPAAVVADASGTTSPDSESAPDEKGVRIPAAERRRGALAFLEVWRSVIRDLGLVVVGDQAAVRDLDLVDDLQASSSRLDAVSVGAALRRIDTAAERLEGNVSPELVLDVLAIAWTPPAGR